MKEHGKLYSKDGDPVERFGFHNLGRHSLASFLMDEQENPAVVQAILRHSKIDMTLYYAHSSKKHCFNWIRPRLSRSSAGSLPPSPIHCCCRLSQHQSCAYCDFFTITALAF